MLAVAEFVCCITDMRIFRNRGLVQNLQAAFHGLALGLVDLDAENGEIGRRCLVRPTAALRDAMQPRLAERLVTTLCFVGEVDQRC